MSAVLHATTNAGWLSGLAAARRAGLSRDGLQKAALAGRIEARIVPGETITYRATDCDAVRADAESRRPD